jgi:3'5'-cyclic nucleotide phosphodiesterase/Adenylate and Guanylate cyclase catalytic domain
LGVVMADLEIQLGPDVSTLQMRFGLHSGPVTAGVVRGDNARFQLFGDSVNTAARMESTGMKGRIQASQDTADLLIAAGKSHWLRQREETVFAKGKGEMTTYWLWPSSSVDDDTASVLSSGIPDQHFSFEEKKHFSIDDNTVFDQEVRQIERLVKWTVDVLARLLQKVAACRNNMKGRNSKNCKISVETIELEKCFTSTMVHAIDEVKEIISLPSSSELSPLELDEALHNNKISSAVLEQLEDYVTNMAAMYNRNNQFHNFHHAAHVILSVTKLLSRIVAPADSPDQSHVIAADPLTQFACVFSALIHDCDHMGKFLFHLNGLLHSLQYQLIFVSLALGVSNGQLVKENSPLAIYYKNRSVAEQNSIDIAWNLLMKDNYKDLRAAIYSSEAELTRFRQLTVNAVLATDVFDPNLKKFRDARWEKAFSTSDEDDCSLEVQNRKATIVIEHLIQASDVAHTMQHWQVYRKWNECLFMEFSQAYHDGRSIQDPLANWYQGELNFFDFYIIPLAKKLKDCGVFGVSSDEYLAYAEMNRREWEANGREIVAEMVEKRDSEILLDCVHGRVVM